MMNIGAQVDKGGVEAMGAAIVGIMQAHENPDIIRAGLDALTRVVKIENITISHCHFHAATKDSGYKSAVAEVPAEVPAEPSDPAYD